ncbi:polysaccharide deacetylase family protein [Cyclobacterium jeungdonense]|uniref:Polysaccharide deacetylase family protein n=1 Tax=Cyclobacterium jeungdonense TaxID=708087 RepID=A0ABT8C3F4_9BACT|nr:polysaccharide deacetylase family protein [Cyclobacterium jeungdonense]MDN3686562.1 polysaccharide deacetylase family protein [Cyclobacterium jeungdonense]
MKKIVFALLRYSGLPVLFREVFQRNKVSILVFHDIDFPTAEKSFAYLSKHYNFISLEDLIAAIQNQDGSKLPKKAMVVTFDDGHVGNHELLPVFKKYKVPVTIFLCSGIIDTSKHYWFLEELNKETLRYLKQIPNEERVSFLRKKGFDSGKDYPDRQSLSATQIEEMATFVSMQSHTVSHPILSNCEDEESKWEITESKSALEKKLKKPINAIAYPNGSFTKREVHFTKKAGYKCGLTVKPGFNSIRSNPFELKRLDPNDSRNINELIVKSSGIQSIFSFF